MKLYRVDEAFTMNFPPYQYALPGLPLGKVGILHSLSGIGKSFWAMQACYQACVSGSCDFQFCALAENPAPVGGRVVYISFEDDWSDFGRRVQAFYRSFREDSVRRRMVREAAELFDFIFMDDAILRLDGTGELAYTKAYAPLGDYFQNLKGVNLVVFDTLSRLHRMDENSNREMAALVAWFERLARWLGSAVLVLHHDNKASMTVAGKRNETENAAAIRGATALSSNVRWHASLRVMNDKEAKKYGIEDSERKRYLRIEMDKSSYSPPQPGAWLKRIDGGVLRAVELERRRYGRHDI